MEFVTGYVCYTPLGAMRVSHPLLEWDRGQAPAKYDGMAGGRVAVAPLTGRWPLTAVWRLTTIM